MITLCARQASSSSGGSVASLTLAPAASSARAVASIAFCMSGEASAQMCVRTSATRGAAGCARSTRRSRPVIAAVANATSATFARIEPDRVERPRVALHSDGRNQLVGRLERRDAAVGAGADHRARGLRAGRDRHHAGSNSSSGTRGRTARRVFEIVRVTRLAGLLVRELGGHGLAEDGGAGAAQHGHGRGVGGRPVALVGGRAVFGRHVGGVVDVLQAHRQAAQRQRAQRFAFLRAKARALSISR